MLNDPNTMVAWFGSIFKTHLRDSRIKPTLVKPHLRLLLHVIYVDRFGKLNHNFIQLK